MSLSQQYYVLESSTQVENVQTQVSFVDNIFDFQNIDAEIPNENVRGVSWSLLATVPKRKSRRSLDMNFLWTAEEGVWKVWKKSNGRERNKETGEEDNHHTTHR